MKRVVQAFITCITLAFASPALADETPPAPRVETIVVRDAEGRPVDAKLDVVERNGQRVLLVTTPAPAPPPPVAPPPIVPPPAPAAEKRESNPWPYVVIAGGATLAVTSAIFQVVAINEDSDTQHYFWASTREDLLPSSRDALRRASESSHDAAQTDQAIAITCGILAVTAVAIGVTWLVTGHR